MSAVHVTRNRVRNFGRDRVDGHIDTNCRERIHELSIKVSNGARDKWQCFRDPIVGANEEIVIDEVKVDLEGAVLVRDESGGHAASC